MSLKPHYHSTTKIDLSYALQVNIILDIINYILLLYILGQADEILLLLS